MWCRNKRRKLPWIVPSSVSWVTLVPELANRHQNHKHYVTNCKQKIMYVWSHSVYVVLPGYLRNVVWFMLTHSFATFIFYLLKYIFSADKDVCCATFTWITAFYRWVCFYVHKKMHKDVVSSIHKANFTCRCDRRNLPLQGAPHQPGGSYWWECHSDVFDGKRWKGYNWIFGPDSERIDHSKYQLINGASQLFIERFEASHAGTYRCVVEMDGLGNCVSRAATLQYIDCELNDILAYMTLLLVLQTVPDFK